MIFSTINTSFIISVLGLGMLLRKSSVDINVVNLLFLAFFGRHEIVRYDSKSLLFLFFGKLGIAWSHSR